MRHRQSSTSLKQVRLMKSIVSTVVWCMVCTSHSSTSEVIVSIDTWYLICTRRNNTPCKMVAFVNKLSITLLSQLFSALSIGVLPIWVRRLLSRYFQSQLISRHLNKTGRAKQGLIYIVNLSRQNSEKENAISSYRPVHLSSILVYFFSDCIPQERIIFCVCMLQTVVLQHNVLSYVDRCMITILKPLCFRIHL